MGVEVPWPISNNPGQESPEGVGRLVNVFVEPRGDDVPVWKRVPGATVFARAPSAGTISLEFNVNAAGATFLSTFFQVMGTAVFRYDASVGSQEIAYTGGVTNNDMVFLVNFAHDQSVAWTTPSGFSSLTASATGGFAGYSCFYKACTGETTVALIPPATAGACITQFWALRGVMTTAPIVEQSAVSTGASGDPDAADLTCTTADSLCVVLGWLDDDNAASVTAPTSFGYRLFNASTGTAGSAGGTVMTAFQPRPTTGAVTISSFDTLGDDEWAAISFSIRHD